VWSFEKRSPQNQGGEAQETKNHWDGFNELPYDSGSPNEKYRKKPNYGRFTDVHVNLLNTLVLHLLNIFRDKSELKGFS
jgi:hypothetical protein